MPKPHGLDYLQGEGVRDALLEEPLLVPLALENKGAARVHRHPRHFAGVRGHRSHLLTNDPGGEDLDGRGAM